MGRPKLDHVLQPIADAFNWLSRRRRCSQFGPEYIQMSEILAWLDARGIENQGGRDLYVESITAMDEVWMARERKRMK